MEDIHPSSPPSPLPSSTRPNSIHRSSDLRRVFASLNIVSGICFLTLVPRILSSRSEPSPSVKDSDGPDAGWKPRVLEARERWIGIFVARDVPKAPPLGFCLRHLWHQADSEPHCQGSHGDLLLYLNNK
ncbi:hypothetical protein BHE74_00013093 [Ensete ventricosum]|nr:hypothetical protein BHE74_00013093 [Ensete ventricosum]